MQHTSTIGSSSAKAELEHLLTTPPPIINNNNNNNNSNAAAVAINPATMAHSALERLRNSGDEHYLFLRALLEILHDTAPPNQRRCTYNSNDELVMFHCITGCRHVVLHGWRRFSTVFVQGLRDWMMLVGHLFGGVTTTSSSSSTMSSSGVPPSQQPHNRTLQIACYTTSVALWKRAWLDLTNPTAAATAAATKDQSILDAQQQSLLQAMQQTPPGIVVPNNTLPFLPHPVALFQYLEHSIMTPQLQQQQQQNAMAVTCTVYLQSLVEEFAGTKSAVTYQLPLEFHRQIRQSFESQLSQQQQQQHTAISGVYGLNASLQLAMKSLSQIVPLLQQQQQSNHPEELFTMSQTMMQIVCDCLSWEFGMDAFTANTTAAGNLLAAASAAIRPPKEWSQFHLTTPALVQALWQLHATIRTTHHHPVAHTVRQVLLLLASLEGPIFFGGTGTSTTPTREGQEQRKAFLAAILRGTLELLQVQVSACTSTTSTSSSSSTPPVAAGGGTSTWQEAQWIELLDTLGILSRLIGNGKWPLLIQFHKDPLLPGLLNGLTAIGRTLWEQHVQEGQTLQGDLEMMEYGDMREDVLNQLLEAVVAVTGDPWLWYSGQTAERTWARQLVGQSLGPLYGIWTQGRMQLAGWEEHYLCKNSNENVEEDYEHISAVQLQEEMESLSTLGRVHVKGAMQSLSNLFQQTMPQLQAQWNNGTAGARMNTADGGGEVSPELAALLEQARLLTLYIGHLLTDDNSGETPVIPDTVAIACREEEDDTIPTIVSAVEALFSLAQSHALKLAEQPQDPSLSPLLANSFLWCLNRWAPAYIYSVEYSYTAGDGAGANYAAKNIGAVWASPEKAQQAVSFAITLCLHFQCYWPQERPVLESAATLLLTLAKRAAGSDSRHHPSKIRTLMVASSSFMQMMLFHCLTAGTRHSMPRSELEQTIYQKARESNTLVDMPMVTGYQRLPYDIKSQILTALLVACSEPETEAFWKDCLKAVQDSFSSLLHALSTKQVSTDDINAKEMTCLCVEMFRGVARASEMADPSRIPVFITPNLAHLSGLMQYYAEDLTICERLLHFFYDYTEQFVIMLNREQCMALFQASASLLKSYSSHHCNSKTRVITAKSKEEANLEEEQKYSDILCAIQLLIHLGTKDFIDSCSNSSAPGIDSNQVTDVIFFGLQQILPLMTQGLLQMPTLCSQYFSLVGFMMDTYPEKIAVLPFELFDALMESLLFGMCHHDPAVAKSSLQGIASITREHLKSNILATHLARSPDFLDKCSSRLLRDVIFQNKVWDRLESAGMALLPLAAVDVNRFAVVVNDLVDQVPVEEQKTRLQSDFQALMQPEVLHKVASGGLEGRGNRIRFKKDFENFCHDVHSFLILK